MFCFCLEHNRMAQSQIKVVNHFLFLTLSLFIYSYFPVSHIRFLSLFLPFNQLSLSVDYWAQNPK